MYTAEQGLALEQINASVARISVGVGSSLYRQVLYSLMRFVLCTLLGSTVCKKNDLGRPGSNQNQKVACNVVWTQL